MRLLRVALMILAMLSLTLVPVGAAARHCHGERSATVAAGFDDPHASLGRHHADVAPPAMPCAHHHDAGKCCGLPCCCATFVACGAPASLCGPLAFARTRALIADDRPRAGVATGRPPEPPISG